MSIASEITRLQGAKADLKTAIEAKGVTVSSSAKLDDYADLVDAIEAGIELDDFLTGEEPSGVIDSYVTSFRGNLTLRNCNNITRVNFYNQITFPTNFFNDCQYLTVIFAPKASISGNSYLGDRCQRVETVVIGSLNNCNYGLADMKRSGVTAFKTVDVSGSENMGSKCFYLDSVLDTVILRSSSIVAMTNVDAFSGTPFASDGTGGTIYIPKTLYDHLGDGTADDYKAATNWATIDGYGTITWAKIEGSAYDGYYADGTAIPIS